MCSASPISFSILVVTAVGASEAGWLILAPFRTVQMKPFRAVRPFGGPGPAPQGGVAVAVAALVVALIAGRAAVQRLGVGASFNKSTTK